MINESDTRSAELAELTAEIVSAYVSNNPFAGVWLAGRDSIGSCFAVRTWHADPAGR